MGLYGVEGGSGSETSESDSNAENKTNRVSSQNPSSPANRSSYSGSNAGSGSRSGSHSPVSRPRSPQSLRRQHSRQSSPEHVAVVVAGTREDEDTRSQSPNLQIDDHASFRSRSGSRSGSGSRTGSSSPVRKSRSKSRSRSRSSVGSKSRHSIASALSRSRSRSRSQPGRSGSGSPVQTKRRLIASGSESDGNGSKKREKTSPPKIKKSKIIDSESEEEEEETQPKLEASDIFGDADDISASSDEEKRPVGKRSSRSRSKSQTPKSRASSGHSGSPRSRSRSRSRSLSRSRSRSRSPRSRSRSHNRESHTATQKEDEVETVPETRIDVEIPRIVTDLGKDIHFVKLPNFLSVDTRPFDPETYEDEIDEEETMDEEGRQRIKLKVSNTIRWREYMDNKGDMIKESNARFVRWSDGSMSLHLGNEIFDVYKQPLHGDHNHMFIRQGTGLQGQAVFRTKLTFRPHSTESFTHKKMTMSLADRSQKTSGIKILTQVGKDPTTDRLYQLKKEEEKLRQAMRSQHRPQPKKKKTDAHGASGSAAGVYQQDEGSDDENAFSVNAIKNKYKKGISALNAAATARKGSELKASAIYSSDDDDGSDFEQTRRHKKIDKAKAVKALRDSDSDSDAHQSIREEKKNDDKSASEKSGNESGGGDNTGSGRSDASNSD